MRALWRTGVVFALLAACSFPVRADPLVMLLMSLAQEVVASAVKRELNRPAAPEPPPEVYAGTQVQPAHLRQLIDDSFTYLSDAQRAEVFDSLHEELVKPANAAIRAPLIEYFAARALQVRAARERLARLTPGEADRLVREFARQIRGIPDEDRAKLREVLSLGLLPVPESLNQRMLGALAAADLPAGAPVATRQ